MRGLPTLGTCSVRVAVTAQPRPRRRGAKTGRNPGLCPRRRSWSRRTGSRRSSARPTSNAAASSTSKGRPDPVSRDDPEPSPVRGRGRHDAPGLRAPVAESGRPHTGALLVRRRGRGREGARRARGGVRPSRVRRFRDGRPRAHDAGRQVSVVHPDGNTIALFSPPKGAAAGIRSRGELGADRSAHLQSAGRQGATRRVRPSASAEVIVRGAPAADDLRERVRLMPLLLDCRRPRDRHDQPRRSLRPLPTPR